MHNIGQTEVERMIEAIEVKPISVKELEDQLLSVLTRHYYVNEQTFDQISPLNMAKHEICHLTKAIHKIQSACNYQSPETIGIVINELMPDLIIYSLEIAIAFKVSWWLNFEFSNVSTCDELLGQLSRRLGVIYDSEIDMLSNVRTNIVKSVSRFGHYCDKNDHNQNSGVNLDTEVVMPFFISSFSIAKHYALNLPAYYRERLIFVESKYVGQPEYNSKSIACIPSKDIPSAKP